MNGKYKCDYCLRSSKDPVNLVCEHILCFSCGSALLRVEIQDELENKYRITCPKCKRITYTYDINNLLLSSSCSVTRNFSNDHDDIKRKKAPNSTRRSQRSEDKTPTTQKKRKPKSISDPNICRTHRQPLTLYCQTESVAFCDKCRATHNTSHKIYELEVALPHIIKKNVQFRTEGKDQLAEIEARISTFLKNREEYQELRKRLDGQIMGEFRAIEALIFKRKEELRHQLECFVKTKVEEIDSVVADLSELRNKLKLCNRAVPETPDKEVYIMKSFETIKELLDKIDEDAAYIGKHSVTIQKGQSMDNLRNNVRNFLCLNLWTTTNAGKLVTPSQYYSQIKSMKKHKLSHSSSQFQQPQLKISEFPPKQAISDAKSTKSSKLREYGI